MKFRGSMKKTICIILLSVIGLSMLFILSLSPYEEWDSNVLQVDYDVVDSLTFIWIGLLVLNVMCSFFAKPLKIFYGIFVSYSIFSLLKLISLLIVF